MGAYIFRELIGRPTDYHVGIYKRKMTDITKEIHEVYKKGDEETQRKIRSILEKIIGNSTKSEKQRNEYFTKYGWMLEHELIPILKKIQNNITDDDIEFFKSLGIELKFYDKKSKSEKISI